MKKTMKNVVILHADQLRYNGLSINGAPKGLTPNIDSIAENGYNFTRHIAANPVCMPSRASLFTGLYPSGHGVWANGVPLNRSCYNKPETPVTEKHAPGFDPCFEPPTMADLFKQAGYSTTSFGKLHFTPNLAHPDFGYEESYGMWKTGKLDDWNGPYYGFDHVEFAQGHGEFPVTEGGHYANWFKKQDPDLFARIMAGEKYHQPLKKRDLYLSLVPSELHNSTWLAERFCQHFDSLSADQPFFTFVGFPDPHHPFTPPSDALTAVEDLELPQVNDLDGKTEARMLQMHRGDRPGLEAKPEMRKLVLRYTMAMIKLMDNAVGKIIDKIKSSGKWEDTIVVFTSDHGDFLGDHGLCYKTLLGCDSLLHIPFLMHVPGVTDSREITNPMSNVDVMPTLTAMTGTECPAYSHGSDIFQSKDNHLAFAYSFHDRDPSLSNFTVYNENSRLTCYPNQDYQEIFDHRNDQAEIRNLANDSAYSAERNNLYAALSKANIKHNNPIAGRISCF